MLRTLRRSAALAGTAMLLPAIAEAHVGVGETSGFLHGFQHPIGGLDHVLAMVLVGLFAWQLGGRALWLVPLTFVSVMALGGALGVAGVELPFVEIGIALSVVVLGAAVALGARALGARAPVAAAMALVGLFAVFHGHAHGAEMPEDAGGLAYGLGFMAGTALLHAVGLGLGFLAGRVASAPGVRHGRAAIRAAGGVAACLGVGLLAGAL